MACFTGKTTGDKNVARQTLGEQRRAVAAGVVREEQLGMYDNRETCRPLKYSGISVASSDA